MTHDNFDPHVVTLQHGFYQYDWPVGLPWGGGAGAQFRRDVINWFRRLPPGTYDVLLRVRYTNGGVATLPHGRRMARAPLTNTDLVLGRAYLDPATGQQERHAGILPGLQDLIEHYEGDDEAETIDLHIWAREHAVDEVELEGVDGSSRRGGGGSHRGGSERVQVARRTERATASSSHGGGGSSSRQDALRGVRRVHHYAGHGDHASRLSPW